MELRAVDGSSRKGYVFNNCESTQNGFATFRASDRPVSGSLYSFQLTGNIVLPASLVAMMTPSSLLAVAR